METLLPSEIARLVLGYLEDQKCNEAAKMFLETSPHLEECRTVLSFGRKFSTKVNGLTLMDVIEKFSAVNTMIQERLNKVTDCEQLKHCGDLIEQLKFLVEEPRGQRFVVNINVPSQNNAQVSNGSPIITSNLRKRRHSNGDRNKRTIKPQPNTSELLDAVTSTPTSYPTIDTTPLESLPGNIDSLKQAESVMNISENGDNNVAQELHSDEYDFNKDNSIQCDIEPDKPTSIQKTLDIDTSSTRSCKMDIDDQQQEENGTVNVLPFKQCTTATSTEELLTFSSTEVQTVPYDVPESESESNDEPIENLSILTKEILNRTELQECIAENINKAILPTELSLREESLNESVGGEGNTSIMSELNNAIKSIVKATESDPVFEKFLDEIIGPHVEIDTSPDEDGEGKLNPKSPNEVQEKQAETASNNISSPEPIMVDTRLSAQSDAADVPLKQRLRSSSRQQNNRVEDEIEKVKDQEKEQNVLEDQNAAAVLSIINANIINNISDGKKTSADAKESMAINDDNGQKPQTTISVINRNDTVLKPIISDTQKTNNVTSSVNVESKAKKTAVKRPRATRLKREQVINNNEPITTQEIMTMPTLILCSKEDINNFLTINSTIKSTSTSHFIPIAPKEPNRIKESMETVYLRTVNVAHKVPVPKLPTVVEESNNPINQETIQSQKKDGRMNKNVKTIYPDNAIMPLNTNQQILNPELNAVESIQTNKIVGSESITLYGNESSAKTSLDGTNVSMINLDENISLSESGLSPYLKFNCNKTNQSHNLSDIDLTPMIENIKATEANNENNEQFSIICKNTECDIITKRTPRSLLKSRSKNHRLSLSTPRRRNSHIRALDFSTPTKTNSNKKINRSGSTQLSSASTKHLKSVCRTSLFKSPSLSNSVNAQKQKSPIKIGHTYKIPIATRSPLPKLMGGWDKYNGVGVIIGDMSPHESTNASCSSEDNVQQKPSKTVVKSWDADLRKNIQLNKKYVNESKNSAKKKTPIKHKNEKVHKEGKHKSRTGRTENNSKIPEMNNTANQEMQITSKLQENIQENTKIASVKKSHHTIIKDSQNNKNVQITKNANNFSTNNNDKVSKLTISCNESTTQDNKVASNDLATEKKPVKKYVQLKTIKTNLKKRGNENKEHIQDSQMNLHVPELSKIRTDNTQHILQISDMIALETPRKFDNLCGLPPTPRVLSPNSNITTPFIKISEDSVKIRSFITTPEFPITPSPKLIEETTRDNMKKGNYNSSYYKPSSEQTENSNKISKSKNNVNIQKSPVISSSHMKLQSIHNSLNSGSNYQTCSSSNKLEITQFEVIKENLPKEEAIKELKIATNSKDCAIENNISDAVINRHVNLTQINDGISKHCKADDNHVDFHNEYDSTDSDSSSSNTSSSSSSSSTSTSSQTNSSTCSPNKKLDEVSNKSHADISSDSAQKSANKRANDTVNDIAANIQTLNNPSIEAESSPKKVFMIAKTDEEIEATLKETPAKDETLLNEANISDTPIGSKSGVETPTNLSSKISMIITKEPLLKTDESLSDCNTTVNRSRAKPKIIDMQCIRPASTESMELMPHKYKSSLEQSMPVHNMLITQLEEKRQRMIAKFKDIPKSNLSNITKHKRILVNKTSDNLKKNNQLVRGRPEYTRAVKKYARKTKINKNDSMNTKLEDNLEENSVRNTRKKSDLQKQDPVDEPSVIENKSKNQNSVSESNTGSNKPPNDNTTKQSQKGNVYKKETDLSENKELKHFTQSNKNSSLESQEHPKIRVDTKLRTNIKSSVETEEVKKELKNNSIHMKISKNDINVTEREVITEKNIALDKAKSKASEQPEDNITKLKQSIDHNNVQCVLKCKVDQVKRDLFSDEENEQKTSCVLPAKDDKTQKIVYIESQNPSSLNVPTTKKNNTENPKEELSTVLQCLQLVPTHKNTYEDENQSEKQHHEQNEYKDKIETVNTPNQQDDTYYKAEYHFVHDDSTPLRKRRRRYSGHELQIEINHADLSDPDPIECIKVLKATEFEEIFNLPPKSKKRTLNKRSPAKNEKDCETLNSKANGSTVISKNGITLPPTDKSSASKMKKMAVKTTIVNRTDHDTQFDVKKKQKIDKLHESVSDITAKNRKRKLSETKETRQIEKRPCTTDPQTLLNNLDLDKFLTTVHGPE